jgi:tRNA(fMet)-specific endonuclease VapC
VYTSVIVVSEIELGVRRRGSRTLRRLLDAIYAELEVRAYDTAAGRYGEVAAVLEEGVPIGVEDAIVAAHSLSLGLTLVRRSVSGSNGPRM